MNNLRTISLWGILLISTFFFGFPLAEATDLDRSTLGLILPVSGTAAEYGTAIINGLELAKHDFQPLTEQVDFVVEDSQYDGSKTIQAFLKLVTLDKVDLIYVWGSSPSEVAAPLAHRYKIPTVLATGDHQLCSKSKYSLCFMPSFDKFGEALTKHFRMLES